MSTEQQNIREQRIKALQHHHGMRLRREAAVALLDGPVARMITDAEQAAERRGYDAGRQDGWDAARENGADL